MPDIFDTLAPEASQAVNAQDQGDIFDQISTPQPGVKIASNGRTVIGPQPDLKNLALNMLPNANPEAIPNAIRNQPQIAKDLETIPTNFLNQLSLNHIRSLANAGNVPIPFEAQNPVINGAAKVAGVVGAVTNPVAKMVGGAKNLTDLAVRSAGAGAAYAPSDNPLDVGQRAVQGGLSGLIPLAGEAARIGAQNVSKSASNYVTDVVAPKAQKMYEESISKFTPEIQKFAEDKLGIPRSAIETIKKQGIAGIENVRTSLKDSTDSIYQKLEGGLTNIRNQADKAYQMAMDSTPEGKSINIKSSIEVAGKKLKDLGLITNGGNLTELGQSEIARDSVYGKLLDFYKSADSISGVKGIREKGSIGDLTINQGSKLMQSRFNTNVNKDQYQFFRDKLNALYKGKPSDIDVSDVVNQFYKDGESSGIKGLQNARNLQRNAFSLEDKYQNSPLIKERKLNNYHNFTEEEKRSLNDLQKSIGVDVNGDLSAVSTGKYIDKLKEYSPDRFVEDLNKAADPKYTNHIKAKYIDILGKDKADEIFNEIIASRRGRYIRQGAKGLAGLAIGAGALKAGHMAYKATTGN